jgi:hypothetical protein
MTDRLDDVLEKEADNCLFKIYSEGEHCPYPLRSAGKGFVGLEEAKIGE